MSLNWARPHYNHASEYQVAGWPFVTSSQVTATPIVVKFPMTTQWVQVKVNNAGGNDLKFGFTSDGLSNGCYYLVEGTSDATAVSPTFHLKCSEIWLAAASASTVEFSVMAGLTNVTSSDLTPYVAGVGV